VSPVAKTESRSKWPQGEREASLKTMFVETVTSSSSLSFENNQKQSKVRSESIVGSKCRKQCIRLK
jgi:hypothetical protein